jgi:CheY-like chemotaxis protein
MSLLILVVDDEPDVEVLFRQHFRRDLRAGRFTMEFAPSGPAALERISDAAGVSLILILSDINMPGMSGLELLPSSQYADGTGSKMILMVRTCRMLRRHFLMPTAKFGS